MSLKVLSIGRVTVRGFRSSLKALRTLRARHQETLCSEIRAAPLGTTSRFLSFTNEEQWEDHLTSSEPEDRAHGLWEGQGRQPGPTAPRTMHVTRPGRNSSRLLP